MISRLEFLVRSLKLNFHRLVDLPRAFTKNRYYLHFTQFVITYPPGSPMEIGYTTQYVHQLKHKNKIKCGQSSLDNKTKQTKKCDHEQEIIFSTCRITSSCRNKGLNLNFENFRTLLMIPKQRHEIC